MNVQSLLLGKFKDQLFNLYRLEGSKTLLFKLSDITFLFKLPEHVVDQKGCYKDRQTGEVYLTTKLLAQLAMRNNKFLLAELCKLKQNDYHVDLDKSILSNIPGLEYQKPAKLEFKQTQIQLQDTTVKIKHEPMSPPPIPKQQGRRLSRILEDPPNKKQKINDHLAPILPKPVHMVSSQKKLSSNKNTRNLTIYAPSYAEQFNGIRSAPLHSNFHMKRQQAPQPPRHSPTEFAIPPIVPSQQHPPHTAHPSNHHHFPPHSPQYPATATTHSFPKTPMTHSIQRQQFMQPFEHLFDTIETTRALKSTLDDQIRRSSTLIQTLQASSTTIEGLVRNQIKESQRDIMRGMENVLDDLFERIRVLEKQCQVQKEVVVPPTVVRSQQEVGLHRMLDMLCDRLDRLERHFGS